MAFLSTSFNFRVAALALALCLTSFSLAQAAWSLNCDGFSPLAEDQPESPGRHIEVLTGMSTIIGSAAHAVPFVTATRFYEVRYKFSPGAAYEQVSGRVLRSPPGRPLEYLGEGAGGARKFRLSVAASGHARECTPEQRCAGTLQFRTKEDRPLQVKVACHRL